MITLHDFDYHLPGELIAQTPASPRDHSRLLVLNKTTGTISHHHFYDLPNLLPPRAVLVRNNTKVIPARLYGQKSSGGHVEVLLIRRSISQKTETWECLTKPGLKFGQVIAFNPATNQAANQQSLTATCEQVTGFTRQLTFNQGGAEFLRSLDILGHTPIPPYIHWQKADEAALRQLYQTTYAKMAGSVAAPTAGLHFTPTLDQQLIAADHPIAELTLHVGLGTFQPPSQEQIDQATLHPEWYQLDETTAQKLNQAKIAKRPIFAIGTTTARTLESCAINPDQLPSQLHAQTGQTTLMIAPPYLFKFVDGLITNFHLPKSSLLMLVSALVSQPNTSHQFTNFADSVVGRAYEEAINQHYRFYSFGDAMMIV